MNQVCFICNALPNIVESEGCWAEPATACGQHTEIAAFPDGTNFGRYLAASRTNAEGSLLSYFLPALTCCGVRAWLNSVAGVWMLFEERYPSKSFGEFKMLHQPMLVAELHICHKNRTALQPLKTKEQLLKEFRNDAKITASLLHGAMIMLNDRRCSSVLDERGLIPLDELVCISHKLLNKTNFLLESFDAIIEAKEWMLCLSQTRFLTHVDSSGTSC